MAALAGFFGALALAVASLGLYGVMSYMVIRRRNEIGVRMALGAMRRDISAMVLSQSGRLVALGCAVGSILAFAAADLARSLVFGIEPQSVGTVGVAYALLVAAVACYLPALRAAGIEPRRYGQIEPVAPPACQGGGTPRTRLARNEAAVGRPPLGPR